MKTRYVVKSTLNTTLKKIGKKGNHVVLLSTLNTSNIGVGKPYSTVTDFAKFLGWSTLHPLSTAT